MKTIFENNGGTYTQVGAYLLPNLSLPAEEKETNISVWAMRHKRYLKQSHKVRYSKKYNTLEIWLLYPVNDEMRNHYPIRFESGDGTTVNLHFVDVDKIEESLQELISNLE